MSMKSKLAIGLFLFLSIMEVPIAAWGDATTTIRTNVLQGKSTLTIKNGAGTLTLPTSTDTLVGRATTDTLTNKTLSGSSNTFSNIGYSSLGLTGSIVNADISGSAAVTYSKLNLTGGILNADISASAAIARSKIAAGTANGVVINDGSGLLTSVAPSTTGNVLTSNGTAWISAAPGAGSSTTLTPSTKTANYTLSGSDGGNLLIADTTSGSFTFTLPAASGVSGIPFHIVKIGGNALTIARTGSDLIIGETSQTITAAYTSIIFYSDGGTNYYAF